MAMEGRMMDCVMGRKLSKNGYFSKSDSVVIASSRKAHSNTIKPPCPNGARHAVEYLLTYFPMMGATNLGSVTGPPGNGKNFSSRAAPMNTSMWQPSGVISVTIALVASILPK